MKPSPVPVRQGFRVRLMSPLGRYPADSFRSTSAALIISPEIAFSVVQIQQEDWSFSEVDTLTAPEIPLLGSILLAGEAGTQYLCPYPTESSILLQTDTLENIEDQTIAQCKCSLVESFAKDSEAWFDLHKPPILGGMKYDLIPSADADRERLAILQRLEIANPVILRGVNCLLKARMAFQHRELGEAACIYLWIALDAAHSLVLQKLRDTGIANPTSSDAARYFEKVSGFGTEYGNFFEDDYENRIRAIHPDNRFGAEAIPQFLADDFYELNDMLIPFFHFFVTENPHGGWNIDRAETWRVGDRSSPLKLDCT